jgi:AcrR family transcriptional regulator
MKLETAPRAYTQRARAESSEATARRIVEAFVDRLLEQWLDEITLDNIAAEAGVTVQTVVRRFGSKEGLLVEAVKTIGAQINAQRAAPPGDIDRLVKNLFGDYERTGDSVIRLLSLEGRHPGLKEVLDFGRGEHRGWVSRAFEPSLSLLEPSARKSALDALIVVSDVYSWKLLRRDMRRSVGVAEATMKSLIHGIIAEFTKPK